MRIKQSDPCYAMLDSFCFASKNLYNTATYAMRQALFHGDKLPSYNDLAKDKNEDYKHMPTAQAAQQTLMVVGRNWKAYYSAAREYQKRPEKFLGRPKLPGYLDKKNGRFPVILTNQQVKLQDGFIHFPKVFNGFKVRIDGLFNGKLQQVRIVPRNQHIIIEIIYKADAPEPLPDNGRYVGVDMGLDNFATIVSNTGAMPQLVNGKGLKAVNQLYNKKKAHYQAVAQQMNARYSTRRLKSLTGRRNAKVKDFLHKASRHLIQRALGIGANTIIIGKNDGWKQEINLSRQVNQGFVQIPHAVFIQMVQYKAEDVGINVIVVEESYTSKTSVLDLEGPCKHESYRGRRVHRGLFRSSKGTLINADVNGAAQIIRKVSPDAFDAEGVVWLASNPVRVTL